MREHSGAGHAFGAKDELKLSSATSVAAWTLGFGHIRETISECGRAGRRMASCDESDGLREDPCRELCEIAGGFRIEPSQFVDGSACKAKLLIEIRFATETRLVFIRADDQGYAVLSACPEAGGNVFFHQYPVLSRTEALRRFGEQNLFGS